MPLAFRRGPYFLSLPWMWLTSQFLRKSITSSDKAPVAPPCISRGIRILPVSVGSAGQQDNPYGVALVRVSASERCGYGSIVEQRPSKLNTRVRFPSSVPIFFLSGPDTWVTIRTYDIRAIAPDLVGVDSEAPPKTRSEEKRWSSAV
jgi:hypothetical protein